MSLSRRVYPLFLAAAILLSSAAFAVSPLKVTTESNLVLPDDYPATSFHLNHFGTILVGGSRIRTFRVHNIDITTHPVTYSMGGAPEFTLIQSQPAIAPLDYIDIQVQFEPDSAGAHTAVLGLTASGSTYLLNLKGTAPAFPIFLPAPDLSLRTAKFRKVKLNKKTGLLDLTLKLEVSNLGTAEATTPTVYVVRSSEKLFAEPLTLFGSRSLKPLPAPVNGKVKSKKVSMKITGFPNDVNHLLIYVEPGGPNERDYSDNSINEFFRAIGP